MPVILALFHLIVIAISFVSDESSSDFGGIGKEILGGFAIAIVVAVAFAFIKLRMRDKNPPAKFISINPEQSGK
jgi:hypothetical protein